MATKYLDNTGLAYFWGKIKSWVTSRGYITSSGSITGNAATATRLAGPKHSYTTAANQAKAWLRIANATRSQIEAGKPLHLQFMLKASSAAAGVGYYQSWFVDLEAYGNNAGLRVFGNANAPFSQCRLLYENTAASVTSSTRPCLDLYLNYVLTTGSVLEIEEIYNEGFEFVADGVLATSTVPSGYENRAGSAMSTGITYSTYATYTTLYCTNVSANTTLSGSNDNHRYRILNCTGTITLTLPSLNSSSGWFFIKNNGTGVITVHPASTSVMFDNVSADITLQPGEFIRLACQSNNHYSIIDDGRWMSQKADKATTLAGYGITDAKIANGTITLGSSSITPLTSVPSHNQASNTINAMTGYSKPSSTSAIASTDSLNTAVGKLEKEDEYLHDEFLLVKGTADNCYAVATAHQQLIEDLQDDVDGKASATHTHGSITNDGKLGTASRVVVTDGNKVIGVSSVTATELGYLSGVTSALQTQINAKAADSAVVHLSGAETIAGTKTFADDIVHKETASNVAVFFESNRATATGAWRCGVGIGGSGKGGFYDWTRSKYFFSRALTTGDIEIIAYPDSGSPAKSFILKSDGTATWNGNAIQTSSDERLKTPLAAVPDEVLDAWGDVGWGQFQFLSAIDCKGESARLHLGLIAQRVKAVFEARGLDACAYGILCHDERPEREVVGEDGKPAVEEAVDLWTVRYAEALAMEAAYQRRRVDRLEARIAALEEALK